MPRTTQLVRSGEPVPLRWGWWHVAVLHDAMVKELEEAGEEISEDRFFFGLPNNPSTYVFRKDWTYQDESDGEIFPIMAGDEYSAWG